MEGLHWGLDHKKTNTSFFLESPKKEFGTLIESCCTRPLEDLSAEHAGLVCVLLSLCVCVWVGRWMGVFFQGVSVEGSQ